MSPSIGHLPMNPLLTGQVSEPGKESVPLTENLYSMKLIIRPSPLLNALISKLKGKIQSEELR